MNNFLAEVEGSSCLEMSKMQKLEAVCETEREGDNNKASYICKWQKKKAVWLFELFMNE